MYLTAKFGIVTVDYGVYKSLLYSTLGIVGKFLTAVGKFTLSLIGVLADETQRVLELIDKTA